MAGMIPGPLIAAPEAVGRRYGLLSAAAGPIDLPPHGDGGGVRYVDATCGVAHSWPIACEAEAVVGEDKEFDPDNPTTEATPFTVYGSLECGSAGYTSREFLDRVQRRLIMGEQGAVEHALWTGVSDVTNTALGISNFTDDAVDISTPNAQDIVAVVAALEEWIYTTQGYGNIAYVHAPVGVAAWAASQHLVEKDGNLLKTPYGSIWVFGGGYPGTGANGDEPPAGGYNLVVTGQTTVWRSADIFTYPIPQTLNRSNNQYTLLAERQYAVGFDCAAGRALFNPLGGS